ncbi:MAG: diadenylate cyclase CdaA [Chloroflexota bacterium]
MPDILWVFSRFDWVSLLDVFLVALVFYWLLYMLRGTQTEQLLRGVLILVLLVGLLSAIRPLRAFNWLVRGAVPALLVSIPVIFQPELRRALERLGRTGNLLVSSSREQAMGPVIQGLASACQSLSERHRGALIVLERETGLGEYIDTGVGMDAAVTPELLETIFFPNTVLHDGAVIIRGDRIVAAACVLPLIEGLPGDRTLGTRHRAALGVTVGTDAVAVVVSEETGIISIAHNGRMIRRLDGKRLQKILNAFYEPLLRSAWPRWLVLAGRRLGLNKLYVRLQKVWQER